METTSKTSCNIMVELLHRHGVKHIVLSPGSRNAPLIVAAARCKALEKTVVVDERSAAFVALGIASVSGEMVALVCTSGTALLNYAPAVAEAYYRHLPLIVISADRPVEWIDQDDSQTLRQYEALANYVKRSYNIPAACDTDTARWYVNRIVNDALITAGSGCKAPVHMNVQLEEPLNGLAEYSGVGIRHIGMAAYDNHMSQDALAQLSMEINNAGKVLVIAGFHNPDKRLEKALVSLGALPNVAVMTESIANVRGGSMINCIDRTLSVMDDSEKENMCPDIVITFGGALVSRHIKAYMRKYHPARHWHVAVSDVTIDCFRSLTMRIGVEPVDFFEQMLPLLSASSCSTYSRDWTGFSERASISHDSYVASAPWSDLKAFSIIFGSIPGDWNLQFSNGTAIRYAQLFDNYRCNRNDCNRGVSGIDGCTSTAIGASIGYEGTTLLITGDMSAQYDVGALACNAVSPRFKMIVMCNGGGGIFRFIDSTSSLPELEDYFVLKPNLPLRTLAEGYGFAFYEASGIDDLQMSMNAFVNESGRPAILAVNTPAETSAMVLKNYFNRNR